MKCRNCGHKADFLREDLFRHKRSTRETETHAIKCFACNCVNPEPEKEAEEQLKEVRK